MPPREVLPDRVQAGSVVLEKNEEGVLVVRAQGFRECPAGIEQGRMEMPGNPAAGNDGDKTPPHREQARDTAKKPRQPNDPEDAAASAGDDKNQCGSGEGFEGKVAPPQIGIEFLAEVQVVYALLGRAADALHEAAARLAKGFINGFMLAGSGSDGLRYPRVELAPMAAASGHDIRAVGLGHRLHGATQAVDEKSFNLAADAVADEYAEHGAEDSERFPQRAGHPHGFFFEDLRHPHQMAWES